MDPYAIISMREQKYKTKVIDGGGKNPKWDQLCEFDVKYIGDDMQLSVFDEDLTSSDLVGNCTIKASAMCVNKGLDDWWEIQFKGKSAGRVHIKTEWHPIQTKPANPLPPIMPPAMPQNNGPRPNMPPPNQ